MDMRVYNINNEQKKKCIYEKNDGLVGGLTGDDGLSL
jgi:hypothetical protein